MWIVVCGCSIPPIFCALLIFQFLFWCFGLSKDWAREEIGEAMHANTIGKIPAIPRPGMPGMPRFGGQMDDPTAEAPPDDGGVTAEQMAGDVDAVRGPGVQLVDSPKGSVCKPTRNLRRTDRGGSHGSGSSI